MVFTTSTLVRIAAFTVATIATLTSVLANNIPVNIIPDNTVVTSSHDWKSDKPLEKCNDHNLFTRCGLRNSPSSPTNPDDYV